MQKTEKYAFRLSLQERIMLGLVAQDDERTPADILRRLIRQEAQQRGLLSGKDSCRREEGQEVHHR